MPSHDSSPATEQRAPCPTCGTPCTKHVPDMVTAVYVPLASSETVTTATEGQLCEVLRPAVSKIFDHLDSLSRGQALQILVDALRDFEVTPSATRPIVDEALLYAISDEFHRMEVNGYNITERGDAAWKKLTEILHA